MLKTRFFPSNILLDSPSLNSLKLVSGDISSHIFNTTCTHRAEIGMDKPSLL